MTLMMLRKLIGFAINGKVMSRTRCPARAVEPGRLIDMGIDGGHPSEEDEHAVAERAPDQREQDDGDRGRARRHPVDGRHAERSQQLIDGPIKGEEVAEEEADHHRRDNRWDEEDDSEHLPAPDLLVDKHCADERGEQKERRRKMKLLSSTRQKSSSSSRPA